jgi:phosphoglycolate phosphatase-like HAD superfamily hydrolase
VAAEDCYVIGDAVWDLLAARRARMLGVGLLTGGGPDGGAPSG